MYVCGKKTIKETLEMILCQCGHVVAARLRRSP